MSCNAEESWEFSFDVFLYAEVAKSSFPTTRAGYKRARPPQPAVVTWLHHLGAPLGTTFPSGFSQVHLQPQQELRGEVINKQLNYDV